MARSASDTMKVYLASVQSHWTAVLVICASSIMHHACHGSTCNPSQLATVKAGFMAFMPEHRESMRAGRSWSLVVLCRSGRHRSQACAYRRQAGLRGHGWRSHVLLGATDAHRCKDMTCTLCDRVPTVSPFLARQMATELGNMEGTMVMQPQANNKKPRPPMAKKRPRP